MRKMMMKTVVLATLASLLMACGGGGPLSKATGHASKMVDLVEANKTDAAAAEAAVDKYLADNAAALATLKTEMEALMKEVKADPSKIADMASEAGEMMKIEQRADALKTENEELRPALRKVRAITR